MSLYDSTDLPQIPATDLALPFQVEDTGLRGRMVRLSGVLDDIIGRHGYPAPVNRLLAEAVTLAALLGTLLKSGGVFTLQAKGDGPVSLLVADLTDHSVLRGCATFDADALAAAGDTLLGDGYLALTFDPGGDQDRYQGIVELAEGALVDAVRHYFQQSEQLATGVVLAVEERDGHWHGGAMLLQPLASEGGHDAKENDPDGWHRAMVLMATAKPEELASPDLAPADLLYRLFHEDGVRVYQPQPLMRGCRCSRQRIENVLATLPRDEVEGLKIEGKVVVTCEFCSTAYGFDDAEIEAVYAGKPDRA